MVMLLLLVNDPFVWASARMSQLDGWFGSWVLDSVFSAGSGHGSVEAWYTSALDIEEVLTGPLILIFISLSLMWLSLLIRLIGVSWIESWVVLACLDGFVMLNLFTMLMLDYGLSWLLALVSLGLVTGVFLRGAPLSMMFIVALYLPWCRYLSAQVGGSASVVC